MLLLTSIAAIDAVVMARPDDPKFILFFDFDGTIIKGNSEFAVIPRVTLKYSYLSLGLAWFRGRYLELMQSMYRDQHRSGVTREQMLAKLDRIELLPGMGDLFKRLGDEFSAEVVVLSNSNTLFVDHILERHGLRGSVARVIANPAEFEADGRLSLRAQGEYACPRCPPNLCKGSVVEAYLAGRQFDGVVGFAGDGPNDVCPMLGLRRQDVAFPRKDCWADRKTKGMRGEIRARLVPWRTGDDIARFLRETLTSTSSSPNS